MSRESLAHHQTEIAFDVCRRFALPKMVVAKIYDCGHTHAARPCRIHFRMRQDQLAQARRILVLGPHFMTGRRLFVT